MGDFKKQLSGLHLGDFKAGEISSSGDKSGSTIVNQCGGCGERCGGCGERCFCSCGGCGGCGERCFACARCGGF